MAYFVCSNQSVNQSLCRNWSFYPTPTVTCFSAPNLPCSVTSARRWINLCWRKKKPTRSWIPASRSFSERWRHIWWWNRPRKRWNAWFPAFTFTNSTSMPCCWLFFPITKRNFLHEWLSCWSFSLMRRTSAGNGSRKVSETVNLFFVWWDNRLNDWSDNWWMDWLIDPFLTLFPFLVCRHCFDEKGSPEAPGQRQKMAAGVLLWGDDFTCERLFRSRWSDAEWRKCQMCRQRHLLQLLCIDIPSCPPPDSRRSCCFYISAGALLANLPSVDGKRLPIDSLHDHYLNEWTV